MADPYSSASDLAKKIAIPPRPEALIAITQEMDSENPDLDRVADILKRDVTLYGAVLRVVNSPALGVPGGVNSIHRAIMLLGLKKVYAIAQVTALQLRLSKSMKMDRFWDSAAEVAQIAAHLADQFTGLSIEEAYTAGMFHDFGIPLMMQAFPDFKALLQQANTDPQLCLAAEETDRYGFNHYDAGFELGRIWFVPLHLNLALKLQPQLDDVFNEKIAIDDLDTVKSLLVLIEMAKNISGTYRKLWRLNDSDNPPLVNPLVLGHIGLTDAEFMEFREDYLSGLDNLRK